ncbi:MAG TPA: hypothetical protein DHV62_09090 [Elusimicrobia bacterium]|nr:hypothetical protein [Elusimicrobiota bacterium]
MFAISKGTGALISKFPLLQQGVSKGRIGQHINIANIAGAGLMGYYGADVLLRVQRSDSPARTFGSIFSTELAPMAAGARIASIPIPKIDTRNISSGLRRFGRSESGELGLMKKTEYQKELEIEEAKIARQQEEFRLKWDLLKPPELQRKSFYELYPRQIQKPLGGAKEVEVVREARQVVPLMKTIEPRIQTVAHSKQVSKKTELSLEMRHELKTEWGQERSDVYNRIRSLRREWSQSRKNAYTEHQKTMAEFNKSRAKEIKDLSSVSRSMPSSEFRGLLESRGLRWEREFGWESRFNLEFKQKQKKERQIETGIITNILKGQSKLRQRELELIGRIKERIVPTISKGKVIPLSISREMSLDIFQERTKPIVIQNELNLFHERLQESQREREKEKERDREKGKEKERSKEREWEREREKEKEKEKEREREKEKEKWKEREKEKIKEREKKIKLKLPLRSLAPISLKKFRKKKSPVSVWTVRNPIPDPWQLIRGRRQ